VVTGSSVPRISPSTGCIAWFSTVRAALPSSPTVITHAVDITPKFFTNFSAWWNSNVPLFFVPDTSTLVRWQWQAGTLHAHSRLTGGLHRVLLTRNELHLPTPSTQQISHSSCTHSRSSKWNPKPLSILVPSRSF